MAKLGTPENPEIIDPRMGSGPSSQQTSHPTYSRWKLARQIVSGLFSVTLPAVILGVLCSMLLESGLEGGGPLPWLALVLLILPAGLFALLAFFANLILLPVLILVLMGKLKNVSVTSVMQDPRMQRFGSLRGFGRQRPF